MRQPAAHSAGRPLAQLVTRAYHFHALSANRLRVASDWFINIIGHH